MGGSGGDDEKQECLIGGARPRTLAPRGKNSKQGRGSKSKEAPPLHLQGTQIGRASDRATHTLSHVRNSLPKIFREGEAHRSEQ